MGNPSAAASTIAAVGGVRSTLKASKRTIAIRLALLGMAILFVSLEVLCRFVLGLGDPPLYQADATMEYMLQPSKTYFRFHNRFAVNRYGMRSDDFPPRKSSPDELRVIVVGDSIVYAGVRIDQPEIDTEILKRDLQAEFGRPVVIGNASAKSWGPPNELAYLQRYGTLDADVVILELSSHDYADAPTFVSVVGVSAEYPDKRPPLAVADLLQTYLLPRYLHIGRTPDGIDKTMINASQSGRDISECRDAERDFFRVAKGQKAKVALVQHLSSSELTGSFEAGYYANQAVAKEENVPYVDDAVELRAKLAAGEDPFSPRDPLHLSRAGQPILAHALRRGVEMALKAN